MNRDTIKQPLVGKINTDEIVLCASENVLGRAVAYAVHSKNIKSAENNFKYSSMFDVYDVKAEAAVRLAGETDSRLASTVNKTKVIRKVLWTVRESISITNIVLSVLRLTSEAQKWTHFLPATMTTVSRPRFGIAKRCPGICVWWVWLCARVRRWRIDFDLTVEFGSKHE